MISSGLDGQELSTGQQDFDVVSACVVSIQRRIATQLRVGFENVGPSPSTLWRALKEREKSFDALGVIQRGVEPNEGYEGVGLLELALIHGQDEVTFALLENGANASELPFDRLNLVWAVGTGRVDVLRAFVQAGGDLGIKTGLGTPLSFAVREGESEMVAILIEAGADPNMGSSIHNPLFEALNKGHEEIALRLLDAGASLAPLTAQYYLDYAIIRSFPRVVERLAAAGCNLEVRSNYDKGKRPQDLARFSAACRNFTMKEAYARVIETPDLVRKKMEHVTPLLLAIYQDEPECVGILLRYGCKADVQDASGMTAFEIATRMQCHTVLPQLKHALASRRSKKLPRKNVSAPKAPRDVRALIEEHLSGRLSTDLAVVPTPVNSASIDVLRKQYDYHAVIERLCDSCSDKNFQSAVRIVAEVCDSRRRDRTGEFGGYDFQLSPGTLSLDTLQLLQKRLLRLGAFVYAFQQDLYSSGLQTIRVIPTRDRYDCLVVQGTSSGNHELDTEDIIAWLQSCECSNPFAILCAEYNSLRGTFLGPIENADELAASMYDLCDDIVDQGIGSIEALANELRESQSMYFWWD